MLGDNVIVDARRVIELTVMAYDERVARRVRTALKRYPAAVEKKMFGGLAFMLQGVMCCGVIGDELMIRVGVEEYDNALNQPYTRVMDFTGKPLTGFVYIAPTGFSQPSDLKRWVSLAARFALSLPAK